MDLQLRDADRQFLRSVQHWLATHLPSDIAETQRMGLPVHACELKIWAEILGRQGWLAHTWPTAFGGQSWTAVQHHLFERACTLACAPDLPTFARDLAGPALIRHGTAPQQTQHLPGIASGKTWWCQGFSERAAGSDLTRIECRGELRRDHLLVTGQKDWVSHARYSHWMMTWVRTAPPEDDPHAGLSLVMVDLEGPGVRVAPQPLTDHLQALDQVHLEEALVPLNQVLGPLHGGWPLVTDMLSRERSALSSVHRAWRDLERLKGIVALEGLSEDSQMRARLLHLEADVVALEMLVLRVLSSLHPHRDADLSLPQDLLPTPSPPLAAMLKLLNNRVRQALATALMDMAGPAALPWHQDWLRSPHVSPLHAHDLHATPLAPQYFVSRSQTFRGGSEEIQKETIAASLLDG